MRRAATIVVAGLAAVGALAACGGTSGVASNAAKKVVEDATGCTVDGQDKSTNVRCKGKHGTDGFSVGTDAKLPDGFPKDDVPVPPGKIVSSFSAESDGKQSYTVTVKVDGSLETAADNYRSDLESHEFTIDNANSFDLGGSAGLRAFMAVGSTWDVNVVGSGVGTQGAANGLVVTVRAHDPSNDSTSTSTSTG